MGENSKKSLLDMPGNVLLKVCRDADFPSMQVLRKVCQNLRGFIDNNIILFAIPKVTIRAVSDTITLKLYLNDILLPYPIGGLVTITYSKRGNNCSVSKGSNTRIVQQKRNRWYMNDNFHYQIFLGDFLTLLKHLEGSMDTLKILSGNQQGFDFYPEFRLDLAHHQQLIKTKSLRVDVLNSSEDFEFMIPVLDPEYFRKLEIVNSGTRNLMPGLGLNRNTEQWRRLEEVVTRGLNVSMYGDIQTCLHVTKLTLNLLSVEVEDIVAMKQEFLRSGPPKHFHITTAYFSEWWRHVELFGDPFENEENECRQWFYRVPDSSHILQISISKTVLELMFVERNEVPIGAVIQN